MQSSPFVVESPAAREPSLGADLTACLSVKECRAWNRSAHHLSLTCGRLVLWAQSGRGAVGRIAGNGTDRTKLEACAAYSEQQAYGIAGEVEEVPCNSGCCWQASRFRLMRRCVQADRSSLNYRTI